MATGSQRLPRGCSTICLPIDKEDYQRMVDSPAAFRRTVDRCYREMPELFPKDFAAGYTLKDDRRSRKLGLRLRRLCCKASGATFTVRPACALPYMVGWSQAAEGPLFLRSFGVPFWALARVFGRDPMYWYRLEVGRGRNRLVGTTVRQARLPEHLLADEHHQRRDGVKHYIATTVAEGCCLGAALAPSAGAADSRAAYAVFRQEARAVQADYRPKTVNTDGWAATQQAWQTLFRWVVIVRCFLHGWLAIHSRGKLSEGFAALAEKVWHAYHAPDRRRSGQRLRRLGEWARVNVRTAWVLEQVQKLCSRARQYGKAYQHPGAHRTSNMLDRVMRGMNRYYDAGQHLHGSRAAGERHCRAWALLYNFRPWGPEAARANGPWQSPAERLNQHRYHTNWLENLLVSASLAGCRR